MWRKNRGRNQGSTCVGTDNNRNWPHKWDGPGSSTSPCSETYRGASAGNTPEVKSYVSSLQKIKQSQGIKLYIDWHSFGQYFMTRKFSHYKKKSCRYAPLSITTNTDEIHLFIAYGYSCSLVPPNNNDLQSLAKGASAAIQRIHGKAFRFGPVCNTIYQVAGGSVDWAQDVLKADNVFTIELRDTGRYGFIAPPAEIVPSGQESFAGAMYLFQNMK